MSVKEKTAIEELKKRENETSALLKSIKAVLRYQTFEDVAQAIFESCKNLIGAKAGYVALSNQERTENEVVYLDSGGLECTVDLSLPMPIRGIRGKVYGSGKTIYHNDFSKSEWVKFLPAGHTKLENVLMAPLTINKKTIGLMGMANKPGGFTDDDSRLATAFGELASVALFNSRLLGSLQKHRDHLEELVEERSAALTAQIEEYKRVEKSLKESEEKFRAVIEQSNDGIGIGTSKGTAIIVNKAMEEITGYSAEEVNKHTWFNLVFPDPKQRELAAKEVKKSLKSPHYVEVPIIRKDGKEIWASFSTAPINLRNKRYFIFISRDITKQKYADEKIQRQLQRLGALRSIDMAITGSMDLRVILNFLLDQVTAQLDVDAADILLLNNFTQTLEYFIGRGFRTDAIAQSRIRVGEGHSGRAALERRTIHISNLVETEISFKRAELLKAEDFICYCAAPLIAKGQVKGVLEVFHRSPFNFDSEWLGFLETLAGQAAIAVDNSTLFDDLQRKNVELTLAYDNTLEGLVHALDIRDQETEGHSERVTEMTVRLASVMGIGESELINIRRGALLHDIGKMGIPDSVLLKPDKLTKEDRKIINKHPIYAYEMLSSIPFLQRALDIPYYHHERWDGSGYPRGFKGPEIPLAARVFAVVDVWEALTNERCYHKAWSQEQAREYLQQQAGKLFDPEAVEVFLKSVISY